MLAELNGILTDIANERLRQDKKWGEQNHPITRLSGLTATLLADHAKAACDYNASAGSLSWEHILMEEVFEALEQAANGAKDGLREELIQCAAVIVAMIESVERNGLPEKLD